MNRVYWGCRIDTSNKDYIIEELKNEILRQGWGWDVKHDLRKNPKDPVVHRNKRMLDVKKGDIILVPRIPSWTEVTIIEATEDWKDGYSFSIDPDKNDYGHKFPAIIRCSFNRDNENVKGGIRSTLHNRGRFWKIPDKYGILIEDILKLDHASLLSAQSLKGRFTNAMSNTLTEIEKSFQDKVHEICIKQFNGVEWEFALVEGLKLLFPEPYFHVERVGGKKEKEHGTDIIIRFYGLSRHYEYIIAIQVKDYRYDFNAEAVISQINKASEYWKISGQHILIDKIVIVTGVEKDLFISKEKAEKDNVHFIFADELKDILMQMAMMYNLHKYN